MTKIIYHYHPETKEYLGQSEATRSPLDKEEVYLIPAFSTQLKPIVEEGKIIKFINNEWILENIPTPPALIEPTLEEFKTAKIIQCKAYLANTDWQVTRLCDPTSGEPLKEGVAEKRALARSLQVDIEACETLEELENININF